MASRDEMIRQLKRRDMIEQLKARDSQTSDPEVEAMKAAEEKYDSEAPSALEAASLGGIQGGLRNFGDDLIAKVASFKGRDEAEAKHAIDQRILRSKEEQPLAYSGSEIATGIATAPVVANPLGAAALAGVDGVARRLGDDASIEEAAITGGIDAVTAGTLSKVAPRLVDAAGRYGSKGADFLKKVANSQAVKSLGGTKGQVEKLGSKADDVGAMLLENRIVTPLASSKTVADRVSQQGEKLAADTIPIYEQAANSKLPAQSLYDEIEANIVNLQGNPGNAPIIAKLKRYQDDLVDSGTLEFNPAEIRKYRQAVDKTINFNSDAPSQVASKEMRGMLRDKEMGLINDVDPELAKANEDLFKNIHLNILAEDMAEKGAAKSAVNNEIGLNTWQAGTQAAAAGATGGTSVVAMAAREFAKRYGNQMSAVALDKVSKAMQSGKFSPMFAKAAERGPSAVAALHSALLSNPEYKALVGDK